MKKLLTLIFAFLSIAGTALAANNADRVPAFPGAEGFGRYTTGGRGGIIYHVTTLEDGDQPGTFRYGCTMSGARIIVFDVCGTIFLKSNLYITEGNVTIAGQTAPGDGICVADYPFGIRADNVIIRYMRFRLGNRKVEEHEGDALSSLDHSDIIIDHCSISWSIDECCSVYGGRNITVQWCLLSQSLVNSGHSKGAHGYGGNWGGSGATYAHNLLIHHTSRIPRLAPRPLTQCDERMDLRNNLIYNWKTEGCYGGEGMKVNIVNNYYKPGPATDGTSRTRIVKPYVRTTANCQITEWNADGTPAKGNAWTPMWHKWGHFYVDGNYNPKCPEVNADNWGVGVANHIDRGGNDGTVSDITLDTIRARKPVVFPYVTTWSSEEAYEKILGYVGCCKRTWRHNGAPGYSLRWDIVDSIMISDVRLDTATYTGEGLSPGFINTQDDVRSPQLPLSWPVLRASKEEISRATVDLDHNGIPDFYEKQFFGEKGVNPNGKCTQDGYRQFTNMDYYLARLCTEVTRHISAEFGDDAGSCEALGDEVGRYVFGEKVEIAKPVKAEVKLEEEPIINVDIDIDNQ
ncbi:MAG: pectate lyase [Bacteroidales bacterium]|jgi:pectate lyase|nr:pectate lyase [Bacteroidales bacterium]